LNLKRHQLPQFNPEMAFGKLAALFLANGGPKPYHTDRLKPLLPFFADIPIGQITKGLARDYRLQRHEERKLTDTTINRDLECLRHILYWAVDEQILQANPLSRLRLEREPRKRRSVMSVEEEKQLLASASKHLRQIAILALDTGMRRGELLAQRWEDVDFARDLLFVTHSKTPEGEAREVPFTKRVKGLLQQNKQTSGLIFTFKKHPIHSIKTAWATALRKSEIRRYRFHDLRHTFNTRLMEAGVIQEIRKALMGHSSGEDVNSIYTHVELPAKREAIRKLELWIAQQRRTANKEKNATEELKHDDGGDSNDGVRESQAEP
jgi:integrase